MIRYPLANKTPAPSLTPLMILRSHEGFYFFASYSFLADNLNHTNVKLQGLRLKKILSMVFMPALGVLFLRNSVVEDGVGTRERELWRGGTQKQERGSEGEA